MARHQSGAARIARAVAATAIAFPLLALPVSPQPAADALPALSPAYAWADEAAQDAEPSGPSAEASCEKAVASLASAVQGATKEATQKAEEALAKRSRVLDYDASLIAAIGSQQTTGHWICCPGFACAYGDAIIHGVANAHEAYGCGCCTWPGWGGGNSSFRSLGSDQALLREAYDSISAGKPTVIHVAGASGEHWICLMGYQNASDPDSLSLDNFIALDPVDGAQIVASERYALYGDACEHVSDAL